MKYSSIFLFYLFVFIGCSNHKINESSERFYYKIISKYIDESEKECLDSYLTYDVSYCDDSIFIGQTYFDKDFIIKNKCRSVYIRDNGMLYSVQANGTRLYLSTQTHEPVIYFYDPELEISNNIFGRIHWYLGTDTLHTDSIIHKFLVLKSLPYSLSDLDNIPMDKDYYRNSEYLFYCFYDKDFILISTETASNTKVYQKTYRIYPFFDIENPHK